MKVAEKKHNSIFASIKENLKETKSFLSIWLAPDIQSEIEEYRDTDIVDKATMDELIDSYNNVEYKVKKQDYEYKKETNIRATAVSRKTGGGTVSRINPIPRGVDQGRTLTTGNKAKGQGRYISGR